MTSPVLETKINRDSLEFQKNTRRMVDLLTEIKNQETSIQQGGGAKAIEAQHKKGRLTARERIAKLIDPGSSFFELGIYAAHEMYEEWGGAPAAGAITGLGRICGRVVMIVANDATVKAGAFFPLTAKKVIRAQNISIDNHIPTVYLVDSSGVFLPLQEDVFPRRGRFWPRLSEQRGDERDGHPSNHRNHGDVRRGRRVSAGDVRQNSNDRRLGTLPRGSGAGAGGHRAESLGGRTWRRKNARGNQRNGRFSRAGRQRVHRAASRAGGQDGTSGRRAFRL